MSYQLRNKRSMKPRVFAQVGVLLVLLGVLSGCLLGTPDGANLRISAAGQLRGAGFYGFLADVESVTVRVFVDTDTEGETDATDPLFAEIVLNEGNNWSVTAPNVPTMTRLLITAEAVGTGGNHIGDLFGEEGVTTGPEVTLFTGSTAAFVTSASAQVSLVLTPFNDGRLNRLPRLEQIRSNLNAGTIEITFNDYGDEDTWWWRVVEDRDGALSVAEDAFRLAGVAEGDRGLPQGQVVFSGGQSGSGPDVRLDYLFPEGDEGIVDWFNRPYWLEVANLQHNMLRQQFIVNPGLETGFVVNFAPFITGVTAGRYRTGSPGEYTETIRWELNAQDVDSNNPESIRALWILKLDDDDGDPRYILQGNIKQDSLGGTVITAEMVADWVAILESDNIDTTTREGLSNNVLAHLDDLDAKGERGVARNLVVGGNAGAAEDVVAQDDAWKLAVRGDLFDDGTTGNLFILVFDADVLPGQGQPTGEPLQYAWSYIRMSIDQHSFPDQSGLVVFDGAILDTPGLPTLRVGSVGPAGGRIFRVKETTDGVTPFTYYETWWIDASGGNRSWEDANAYADAFNGGGKDDWRLPTTEELQFMYRNRGALGGFVTGPFYWSGDSFGSSKYNVLDFTNPSELIRPEAKDSMLSVRVVRTFTR